MIDRAIALPRERVGAMFRRLDSDIMAAVSRALILFLGLQGIAVWQMTSAMPPKGRTGTVKLTGLHCRGAANRLSGWHDDALLPILCRLPFSRRGHQLDTPINLAMLVSL
jgi:hypothetical protein